MKNKSPTASGDKVGKVFMVEEDMQRRCLVCDELFNREGARQHSTVACYPKSLYEANRGRN